MTQLAHAGFSELALHGRRVHLLSRFPESDRARVVEALAGDSFGTVEVSSRPLSMEDVFIYRVTELERREAAV